MAKKIIISLIFVFIAGILLSFTRINAVNKMSGDFHISEKKINVDSNFFTEVLDETPVEMPNITSLSTYQLASENEKIALYYHAKTFNIAIHDKRTGYIWYSDYKKVAQTNKTGLYIEVFNTSGREISSSNEYFDSSKCSSNYELIDNGFKATITFKSKGITIVFYITIDDDKLKVDVPVDEIKEDGYDKINLLTGEVTDHIEYKLSSMELFFNFGSGAEDINGYSFIPDGSGALIKYTDVSYSTAYIKRLYGTDYGVQSASRKDYLKEEGHLTLPIYGVNHGYNQAAFLAVMTNGSGASELNSWPKGYDNKQIYTTFFRFYLREKYTVPMSTSNSSSISVINDNPYADRFTVEYNFLSGSDASYIGMANAYRDRYLILNKLDSKDEIPLNLDVIAQDYKNGLFGKNFQVMTSYKDLLGIIQDLESDVSDFNINYIGYNKNGYFNNSNFKPRTSSNLGSKKDFLKLMNYIIDNDYSLSAYLDIVYSYSSGINSYVTKKPNLSVYETKAQSSLLEKAYYSNPGNYSNRILKYNKQYSNLKIDSISLPNVGNVLTSYRYKSKTYYRDSAIKVIEEEIRKISEKYKLGLIEPNNYALSYIDKYYEAKTESNKYSFMTSSIPFISLLLAGNVELYSDTINYISDYDLYALRLVEYDIYPSFLVTKNETYNLRYTNFEYVYTSEYKLWESKIREVYKKVNDALKYVYGANIISHKYIQKGVAEVKYDNGKTIYVNYTDELVNYNGHDILASSYLVV